MSNRIGFCALSVLLMLAACKGGAMVKAQEEFADKTCACKEVECVKKVSAEQVEWVTKNGSAGVGNEADAEKIAAANKRLTDCATKLIAAGH